MGGRRGTMGTGYRQCGRGATEGGHLWGWIVSATRWLISMMVGGSQKRRVDRNVLSLIRTEQSQLTEHD